MLNFCGYYSESISEGEGLRSVIFISGCLHHCKGCFNPKTWNFSYGEIFTEEKQTEIIEKIASNPLLDGLTIAGGDPFFSSTAVAKFVERCRNQVPELNIWIYSGFTFEEIMQKEDKVHLLSMCNVLVDGKFIEKEKDVTLRFKGSKNQRIIDIQKSLDHKIAVIFDL